jgi:hypothetical protein
MMELTVNRRTIRLRRGDFMQIKGPAGHYTVEVVGSWQGQPLVVDHQRYPRRHPLSVAAVEQLVAVFTYKREGRGYGC